VALFAAPPSSSPLSEHHVIYPHTEVGSRGVTVETEANPYLGQAGEIGQVLGRGRPAVRVPAVIPEDEVVPIERNQPREEVVIELGALPVLEGELGLGGVAEIEETSDDRVPDEIRIVIGTGGDRILADCGRPQGVTARERLAPS